MGSWSESCGVSGLEVSEQNACYGMIFNPRETEYGRALLVPPTLGVYADYGCIELTEDSHALQLNAGDEWSPHDHEHGNHLMFVDAQAFDLLGGLHMEWGHDGQVTIDDAWRASKAKIDKLIQDLREDGEEDANYVRGLMSSYDLDRFMSNDVQHGAARHLRNALETQQPQSVIDAIVEDYRRSFVIFRGMLELRKKPATGRIHAPQHNGEVALEQFYVGVLDVIRQRKRERELEDD